MCGRYCLFLRPSQIRAYLENENMPVDEAPDDDGEGAPRQSYNFAPGYHGLVYRADTPDTGAGSWQHSHGEAEEQTTEAPRSNEEPKEIRYKLQSMKWGLIPFWTKCNPDYGSMMKTINCRDDSLIENRGMWTTMKQKKRCIIVAQGFYEWLKKGKDKVPHYTKRKDGRLMCFAGLWDCAQYEGLEKKHYTYTVITTDSNKQLNFLHDRMPVILENGSEEIRTWLDPNRQVWSKELQSLLKPFRGELECYPVSKEVGKVRNSSPNLIIPVASTENKSNIANFFAKVAQKVGATPEKHSGIIGLNSQQAYEVESLKDSEDDVPTSIEHEAVDDRNTINHDGMDNAPLPIPAEGVKKGVKRELEDAPLEHTSKKLLKTSNTPKKLVPLNKSTQKPRSATSNNTASPSKPTGKDKESQKITNYFKK